ncbi:putative uncharacterized protein DDB_G0282499, partial [Lucilia sericata]|uniref:putative uncharacterized protein DDB_G0282499 n=1 Tax=Lucilia sericata TaxID=13632 RepID=UPI0018A84B0D
MPEASATKQNEEIATMSTRANFENTTASKLPVYKWNRSNSINVTYIPLLERRQHGLRSNDDDLIAYVNDLCQNDACSLRSSNGSNLCCCSQRTNSSSCWHLKRKQIIRQSSHASAKNRIDISLTEIATHSTKKSISLPATPNLSQLRRPVRSSYKKLNEQQTTLTTEAIIHMPLTYEQFRKRQQLQTQTLKTPTNLTSPLSSSPTATTTTPPTSPATPTLSTSSPTSKKLNTSTRSMLLKHRSVRYEETTTTTSTPYNLPLDNSTTTNSHANDQQHFANNNNNSNNATICATIINNNNNNKMSKTQGCFLQTCSYQNENGEQKNNTINSEEHKITNTPRGGAGGGGGFLRCEHCCESMGSLRQQSQPSNGHRLTTRTNNGQNTNYSKSTSLGSDHYQRSDSETVSELSSYRFVTDEDIGIVVNVNDKFSSSQSPLSSSENENQIKRFTECVSNDVEETYDDNVLKENINSTTTKQQQHNETNNFKNKNEYIQKEHEQQQKQYQQQQQPLNQQQKRDRYYIDLDHNKTSRAPSVQTPTNCCYTIDKSHSDQFIPYVASNNNNNNNINNYNNNITKPVQIPVRNETFAPVDLNLNDCSLSSSLPRNYGSNFDTYSFARQVYIRNSVRSQKTAPPVPPKPITDLDDKESSSYDPQKFYRKLQKFEKQSSLIQQQSLPREIPSVRSQERSITPERCELLNCFPSYRNRNQEQKSSETINNSAINEHLQQTENFEELLNHSHKNGFNPLNTNGHINNNNNNNNNNTLNKSEYSTPKRTLRYDNHGRLKSSFLTQLPVTNYRRASLDTDSTPKCHSPSLNLKLTPTLTRKFQYSPKHTITKEINEETEEEIEEITPSSNASVINEQNNNNHNTSPPLLNSPTSPALSTRSLLPQKKSYSSPIVLHHDRLSSPVWLSTDTLESHTSSSQKCLDEVQSNCSDQTTIFHFEHDNSNSSSPSSLLYGSGGVAVAGQHYHYGSNCASNGGNIFKGPLLVKRLPAIQSFGYIPTQSSSLGSANVREEFEKE